MTLLELIERIKVIATGLSPGMGNPLILDSEVIIEVILPRVFALITAQISGSEDGLNALRDTHTLTFSAGIAPMPVSIREEYIKSIFFVSYAHTSYVPRFEDFMLSTSLVDTFTVQSHNIYFRNANDEFGTFYGPKTIDAITLPSLPALVTDQVMIKADVLEKVIFLAAGIVNGSVPLSTVASTS